MDLDGKGRVLAVTCRSARSVTPRIAIWPLPTTLWAAHWHRAKGGFPSIRMKLLPSGENANSQSHSLPLEFRRHAGLLRQCR